MIEAYIPKFLNCLYHEKIDGVIGGQELRDMFHSNQINSIYEMLKACDVIVPKLKGKKTVYIGSWMGFKTRILCEMYGLKITELEIDKRCGNVSKIWNEENRYYVGHIYEDANKMSTNFYSLNDLVINPSCEHMSDEWFNKIPKKEDGEDDMLDMAFEPKTNSRLSCQIIVSDEIDGLEVNIPSKQA